MTDVAEPPAPLLRVMGRRVRKLRKRLDMTQADLGNVVGVSLALISRIERGERSVRLDLLTPLSKALGITVDQLISGEEWP